MRPAADHMRGGKARKAWQVMLVLAAIPSGFVLGAWLGGRLLVPDDAGLAGGAMVLWYGLSGLAIAVVGALMLARHLPASRLKAAALSATGLALTALLWLGARVWMLGSAGAVG